MKLITAYVSTVRIHWLAESLQDLGVKEMKVTEYFSPMSRISRMQLICTDDKVQDVIKTVHKTGTTGESADHLVHVGEFVDDPDLAQMPGSRISVLDFIEPESDGHLPHGGKE